MNRERRVLRALRGMALGVLSLLAGMGCGAIPSRTETLPRLEGALAYREARAELLRRRAERPTASRAFSVETRFTDQRTGLSRSARGAIAIRPPDGLRLQLVGPAGQIALDVWMGPAGARLSSPLLGLKERTGPGEHRPGRPTSFLSWWMLHPFDGRLLAVTTRDGRRELVVRGASGEIVTFHFEGDGLTAERRTAGDLEHVTHRGAVCGSTTYESERALLRVELTCTAENGEPKARAFDDPDGLIP